MPFHTATKQQSKLRLALIGPAGSGKTYTALTLATHLVPGGRIAVIDTERGSASKYADLFRFDVQELESFHPKTYIDAIAEAQTAGYAVLIIDSLSHAWMGKDGALELVDKAAKRNPNGNSFAAWRDVTPLHNQLVDAMLAAKLHVIVTLRSKMEYVQEKDERGKTVIRKVGLQPVQRDGLEYEFDVVGDMDTDNTLIVTKTRCSTLQSAFIAKPGPELAATLRRWLSDGAPPPAPADAPSQPAGPLALPDSPSVSSVPPPLPLAATVPVITAPSPTSASGNGHGHVKAAKISTARWQAAAQALAVRCPTYAKPDGQPDYHAMTKVAAEHNYADIVDANLAAVIAVLELAAQTALPA